MTRRSLVLLVALLMAFGVTPAPNSVADPAPPPVEVDSDGDGLSDGWELIVGTRTDLVDTDGDGLADGADPDVLIALSETFDDSAFAKGVKGLRMAIVSRLFEAEIEFLAGDIRAAVQSLEDLRMRFDGCPPEPDPNDWIVDCDEQLRFRTLLDIVIANHFSYVIDPTVEPPVSEIPGLSGGPARTVAAVAGPDGAVESFVENEVIVRVEDPSNLAELIADYGAAVLRDGTPLLVEGENPNPALDDSIGYLLLRIDTGTSPLEDFGANMEKAGLVGRWTFSSEAAARLVAMVAREQSTHEIAMNHTTDFDVCTVCEHPDDGGGNLDAATWWWMTDKADDPSTPQVEGAGIGVIRAWDYLRYQGFPPLTPYYATKVAIVDGGFDLDTETGVPLFGGGDFLYSGSKPPQLDELDYDWTAGGIALGFSNCPGGCWHGQLSFGACCANGRNLYGTAGTSGGGTTGAQIKTLLIRVGPDVWQIATAVYDAIYNNADVVNTSIAFDCGSICHTFQNGNVLEAAVNSARNVGSIVVASAGNDGVDISGADRYPCEIDGAICVGAIEADAEAWDGSNFGSVVDMWAPTGIRSTLTRTSAGWDANNTGIDELAGFGGTSCSAPYLSGVVALMKTLSPNLYKSQVLAALQASVNSSTDAKVTPGYVDALAAMQQVKPNLAPTVDITSHVDSQKVPYDGVFLGADVVDPEKSGPWGDQFDVSVTFTSDRQGKLCEDEGAIGPYACQAPTLLLGTHTIVATATDAFGAVGTDSVIIEVVNTPPTATITYPMSGSTFYTSQTVFFAGFGFDPDEQIMPADLSWHSSIDGSLGTGVAVSAQLSSGTHTITLTATDDRGATGTDTVTLNVVAGAGYPTAQIVSPPNATIVAYGDSVTFTGSGTDPEDGPLSGTSLEWSSDVDGLLGTGTSLTVTLSGEDCSSTVHEITLTVTDSDGHVATHTIWVNVVELC